MKYNNKRIEINKERMQDAFALQEVLLRNGYDCFVWMGEYSVVIEYEANNPEYREGVYVYIDPENQYVAEVSEDEIENTI